MIYIHVMKFALHEEPYEVEIPEGWEVVRVAYKKDAKKGWKAFPSKKLEPDELNILPLDQWEDLSGGEVLLANWQLVIRPSTP